MSCGASWIEPAALPPLCCRCSAYCSDAVYSVFLIMNDFAEAPKSEGQDKMPPSDLPLVLLLQQQCKAAYIKSNSLLFLWQSMLSDVLACNTRLKTNQRAFATARALVIDSQHELGYCLCSSCNWCGFDRSAHPPAFAPINACSTSTTSKPCTALISNATCLQCSLSVSV